MSETQSKGSMNHNARVRSLSQSKIERMTEKEKEEWKNAISWFFLTDTIKKKIRLEIQSKMKIIDILTILFSGLGLLTNGLQSMFYLHFEILKPTNDTRTIQVKGESKGYIEIFRFITTFSSLISISLIIMHYNIRKYLLIFKQQVELGSSLLSTKLLYPLIIEILLNLIHTPPYLNNVMINISTTDTNPQTIPIDLDLFFSVFVPFRVYLLFKFYAFYSKWGDDRAERVCKESNAEGGVGFALKAEIRDRPYFVVFFLMLTSIILFGYCLRNTEIAFMKDVPVKLFQDWTYMWNGFWCITITIFTVGYGDYYPHTHFGRIITIIACLWGTFLVSLMVVAITNSMELSPQQLTAYNEIKQSILEQKYKEKALTLIRYYYNARALSEEGEDLSDSELKDKQNYVFKKAIKKLQKALDTFREARKEKKSIDKSITIESLVSKINKSINDNMDKLVRSSKVQVNNLMEHIKYSKNFQETIKVYIQVLENMTEKIYKTIKKQDKPLMNNNGTTINQISNTMGSNLLSLELKPSDIPGCNETNVQS